MSLDAALIAATRAALNAPTFDARIEMRADAWRSDAQSILIRWAGFERLGHDEKRLVPTGLNVRETIEGARVLRIAFICDSHRQDFEESAEDLADRLMAGFQFSTVEEILDTVNLARPVFGAVLNTSAPGRYDDARSLVIVNARFNYSRTVQGPLHGTIGASTAVLV